MEVVLYIAFFLGAIVHRLLSANIQRFYGGFRFKKTFRVVGFRDCESIMWRKKNE